MDAHKTARKTGRPRLIPLTRVLLRYLRLIHRARGCPTSGAIFLNSKQIRWGQHSFTQLFQWFAKIAGVRRGVTPYTLRHGFCVKGLEAGAGAQQLADVLGHTSVRYVDWYGRGARENADYLRGTAELVHRPPPKRDAS